MIIVIYWLQRKFSEKLFLGSLSSGCGFLFGGEVAQVNPLAVFADSRAPRLFPIAACKPNALDTAPVIFGRSSIPTVLLVAGFAEVGPAIIVWYSILVIHFALCPTARHVEEGERGSHVLPTVEVDAPVAGLFEKANPFFSSVARMEKACLWVIADQFEQARMSDAVVLWHGKAPLAEVIFLVRGWRKVRTPRQPKPSTKKDAP